METFFKELFLKRRKRPFSAFQIELTTRCPLSCRMCIREGISSWHYKDMKLDDFRRIAGYFNKTENIILQGWGEPVLYKNLIEAVRIVKEKGASAGFVTSGSGLNKNFISELINAGVDFIGFSLAGAMSKTHNSIRISSDLQCLLDQIKTFNKIKKDKKIKNPKLHIVYLMLKDNISEVPALIELAKGIGIEEVVLTNLIHVTNEWQERQRVFRCEKENKKNVQGFKDSGFQATPYEAVLKEAEIRAKELDINFKIPNLSPVSVPVCDENPLRNLYISVDGEVSPCVYLYPPISSPFKRIFCGDVDETEKISFGNILNEPFDKIWSKNEYSGFRGYFEKRLNKPLPDAETKPPAQCRICHKMLGV